MDTVNKESLKEPAEPDPLAVFGLPWLLKLGKLLQNNRQGHDKFDRRGKELHYNCGNLGDLQPWPPTSHARNDPTCAAKHTAEQNSTNDLKLNVRGTLLTAFLACRFDQQCCSYRSHSLPIFQSFTRISLCALESGSRDGSC